MVLNLIDEHFIKLIYEMPKSVHAMSSEYLIVNVDPFVIRFPDFFPIAGIKWYGVCYVLCFFLILRMLNFYSHKKISHLSKQENDSLIWYFAIGIIIGGRLGYELLYELDSFMSNPIKIFFVWNGGMASHGGFIGAIIGIILYAKKYNKNLFAISDLLCAIIPICLFLGRCCNFINAELVGKVTDVPWAMIFIRSGNFLPRHPSQLYEAFGEGVLLFFIMQYLLFKQYYSIRTVGYGKISSVFLIFYSSIRILCEIFREPDAPLILNLSRGQFYSIFTLIFGVCMFLYVNYSKRLQR
jgi:phosphatidylglycerol:prolipoprotein diacylglycerol transferase